MKRGTLFVFLLVAVLAHVFAQQADPIELPEPGFNGIITIKKAVPAQKTQTDLSYFWDSNPQGPSKMEFRPIAMLAAVGDTDAQVIPVEIRNNQYFRESQRLQTLAKTSYDEGDYDASTEYATEAIRYAQLSDEFVALQLLIREANLAITAARDRISWATARGIDKSYPNQFNEAQGYYNEALDSREKEEWEDAITLARRVLFVLADATERLPLPAQYTVRTWMTERDCLWNIAGYSWVYNDAFQWKRLYEANKTKMPEPNNPDLIHPGTILDIPNIRGENRQGMWQAGRSYNPLP